MENVGDRIKALREKLGNDGKKMSQTEFGKRIGLSQNAIANVENGNNGASESAILNIVREFHVNETWLRTGEGEMFRPMTRTNEISAFIGKVLKADDDIKQRVIWALSQLSEDEWDVLEKMLNNAKPRSAMSTTSPVSLSPLNL